MRIVYILFAIAVALLCIAPLAGCASAPTPPPEPVVQTVQVRVPVAVPCKALAELGEEPSYPDTNTALREAPNIFERVKLLLSGRAQRAARLEQYRAANGSC